MAERARRSSGPTIDPELVRDIAGFEHDPLGYVLYNWPWGEPGTPLADYDGPRKWQREFLEAIGRRLRAGEAGPLEVLQEAVATGHGTGKSTTVAWLTKWALDTFEDTRVVITANTDTQLRTKTWPELAKWHRMSLTESWFTLTATSLYANDARHERTWRADLIPWNERQPESFQGLHNEGKRIVVLFDEASAIHDVIWEATEGALTDERTEILWCVFGNPTRTTGRFRECFGRLSHRWKGWQIDARDVEGTNKQQIQAWIDDYGEDSDFVRVRVRGMFPRASSMQFIPHDVVARAASIEPAFLRDDPLILGIDMARGGDDELSCRFRRGRDARSIPGLDIPGSETRDSEKVVPILCQLIDRHKPDVVFLDATGIGGPIGDRLRHLGYNAIDVHFGAGSPEPRYADMGTYMWAKMLEGLRANVAIPTDPRIQDQLTGREYDHDKWDRLKLESKADMKRRGFASPDRADALALTFASPVAPKGTGVPPPVEPELPSRGRGRIYWNPFQGSRGRTAPRIRGRAA